MVKITGLGFQLYHFVSVLLCIAYLTSMRLQFPHQEMGKRLLRRAMKMQ